MPGAFTRLGVLVCVATLVLASCSDNGTAPSTTDRSAPSTTDRSAPSTADSMESAVAGEPDRVVAVYNGQERYVAAAREKPDAALPALYTEHVVDPYWETCFSAAAAGTDRSEFGARITLSDTDRLGASAETLRAADATKTLAAALAEARVSVDTPPITICVMAGYPATRFARLLDKTGGVMTTTADQTVVMAVNPEVDGWQALMGYAAARDGYFLAQENCCWGADRVPNLLEAVVSIGKAHTFGKLLYPQASSPQTDALTPQQEAAQWERMSPDLTSQTPELIEKYLFIRPSGVPRWAGHTIGYHIVHSYLDAHPEATLDEWTHLAAATMLDESGYTGRSGTDTPAVTTPPTDPFSSATWSRVPHDEAVFGGEGNQEMHRVTAGGPGLVAVGSDGTGNDGDAAVWTSPDGSTWSRVPHDEAVFGGTGSLGMSSVTAGGPGLVAAGFAGGSPLGDRLPGGEEDNLVAAVWTSPDGITWSRVPHDEAVFGGAGNQMIKGVTVGGPGLVAVGSDIAKFDGRGNAVEGDAAVWTSPDGVTWSRVPHDEAVFGGTGWIGMSSVTAGGPGLVAVGSDGDHGDAVVWTSPDGVTWTRVPHDEAVFGGASDQRMFGVTVGGPGLVAVGGYPVAVVWTSPDGMIWSRVPHNAAVFGGSADGQWWMRSVTVGGPGLVAVGTNRSVGHSAVVWTSPDGVIWSRVPHDEAVFGGTDQLDRDEQWMMSVTAGGPGLVAVGASGTGAAYADSRGAGSASGDFDAAVWKWGD